MTKYKKLKVHARRTQWAVGHGGFHSGIVQAEHGASQVTWMYDCGTASSGKSLSAEFRLFQKRSAHHKPNAKLDLLFLSHFHEDHVGGIGRLIRGKLKISHIFAPLISPLERLLALAASDDPIDPSDLDFYLNLIADPIQTLLQVSGAVTLVIPGADGITPNDIPAESPEPDSDEAGFSRGTPAAASNSTVANCWDATSTISTDSGRPVWVFEPYVLKEFDTHMVLQTFKNELALVLNTDVSTLDQKLSDSAGILRLIKNRSCRAKFRQAYENVLAATSLKPDLNLTSLCLYSGPHYPAYRTWRSRWPIHNVAQEDMNDWIDRHEIGAWTLQSGWLHTGDASLQHQGRREEFLAFYQRRLPNVGAFLLPHHGADTSFDAELLQAMDSNPLCIAASKPGHGGKGWIHPGHTVVGAVSANGNHLLVVSDTPSSRYSDTLTIEF
jgi:hypothetical protein